MSGDISRIFGKLARFLWGDFESKDELRKFLMLGFMFSLIIGVYWTLRPMKDSNFLTTVGKDYLAWAKGLSILVIVPIMWIYGKLVDALPRHKVFYVLIAFFSVATLIFGVIFHHPTIGLPNEIADPTRVIGWIWYVFVESYGSLVIMLFWVLVTDMTTPESAKRGFPMIVLLGQVGNIVGPWLGERGMKYWGLSHAGPLVIGSATLWWKKCRYNKLLVVVRHLCWHRCSHESLAWCK